MSLLTSLPDGCKARIVSLTSPKDACRVAAVSTLFKLIADSDTVWEQFLPPGYQENISGSDSPVEFSTKKELYFRLCDSGLLLDGGRLHFRLSKLSGKKCYLIRAQDLCIPISGDPQYWTWKSLPESKFSLVAELLKVCWFDIQGMFPSDLLSPDTTYAAYLVYKIVGGYNWFWSIAPPMNVSVICVGRDIIETGQNNVRSAYLATPIHSRGLSAGYIQGQRRADGWMEIELGEFFLAEGHRFLIQSRVVEIERLDWKYGLIVEGIEMRPKEAF